MYSIILLSVVCLGFLLSLLSVLPPGPGGNKDNKDNTNNQNNKDKRIIGKPQVQVYGMA